MSQNSSTGGFGDEAVGGAGGARSGANDARTTHDTSTRITTTGAAGGAAAEAPPGIARRAKEYGQAVTGSASQAKDYLSDKASAVGEKLQDLRNKDFGQLAEHAKEYARENPGQALLIAAAAGFLVSLLLRPPGDPTTPPPPPRKRR
jgi:ElaB/YqjD/DUF883 family membrane-anchored ribosome-binding protein